MIGNFHYIQCSVCGEKLCVETDSYRYTDDGQPICYECDENT